VAYSLADLGVDALKVSSYLEISTRLQTQTLGGIIFDQYSSTEFKFAAIDATTGKVVIGHYTAKHGWVSDVTVAKGIVAGTDYDLKVVLKGSTVSVSLNNQVVLGYTFNAVNVDGGFGLLSRAGRSSFDSMVIKTDDPAFANHSSVPLLAADGSLGEAGVLPLAEEQLASIREEAIARLAALLGLDAIQIAALRSTGIEIADLPGLMLGTEQDGSIVIDGDAAGRGWFVDATPDQDSEFRRAGPDGQWATPNSAAFGQFDLLSAVMHELGHVAGLDHADDGGFMQATLSAGQRTAPAAKVAVFDNDAAAFVSSEDARALQTLRNLDPTILWQAAGWQGDADENDPANPTGGKAIAKAKNVNWNQSFAGYQAAGRSDQSAGLTKR
jgi:hypothetical protein